MKKLIAILAAVVLTAACGGGGGPVRPPDGGTPTGTNQISGAGATFPYPIYSKWFSDYNKLHPNVEINYQSIGSGGGIRQLIERTVFFGASDQPMTDEMLAKAPAPILHFPTVLGAVVPVYNIEGLSTQIKFTGPILADIFLGKITRWNDPALAKINPGVSLPSGTITVVHRSDGSGTTFVWVDYLSKISPEWKQKVGASSSVNWPVGVGGKGNEGVAGLVKQTPASLGYVELVYALQNKISYGAVQNEAGEFVSPEVKSVTAAAAGAMPTMPKDFRVSITNSPGQGAYPISSFTWILLYESPDDKAKGQTLNDFMKWALTDGQKAAADLGYAPLPEEMVPMELEQLNRIKVQ
ncbi:MAG: phosphate ABC transporter substrate-binding protein PstS [Acidobacteria bacterium]|nr:MAG: phosphate ABC transporter substrate-binding protein PstS [Acidobacteriota bacterium]